MECAHFCCWGGGSANAICPTAAGENLIQMNWPVAGWLLFPIRGRHICSTVRSIHSHFTRPSKKVKALERSSVRKWRGKGGARKIIKGRLTMIGSAISSCDCQKQIQNPTNLRNLWMLDGDEREKILDGPRTMSVVSANADFCALGKVLKNF
jgi:hypothetical protein